ncbi:MAG: hypothetical protein Q9196_000760 [Gyalolechia fulgens]
MILRAVTVGDGSQEYTTQDTITGTLYTLKLTLSVKEPLALELVGSHPNVVSLFQTGSWFDTAFKYMVLDTYQNDLQYHILQSHKDCAHFLNEDRYIVSTFIQILDALECCHRKGVYHRDLKPENIFICDGGLVRLANFSLAFQSSRCGDFESGTEAYMAPECWPQRKRTYNPALSDIWSLGVILINLVCHRYPWTRATNTDDGYVQYWQSGQSLSVALNFSPHLDPILNSIFQHDPKDRVSIFELRKKIVECSEFRRREPFGDTMPLDVASGRVLLSDPVWFTNELAQGHQYYDAGDVQQKDTTDWYQPSAQTPEHTNCVNNEYDMVLCDSDFCLKCVEESHALCNAPHIWTDFTGYTDTIERFGL